MEVCLSYLRFLIFRGAPNLHLDKLSNGAIVGSVLGVAGVTVIICICWLLPYFHRRLVLEDWTIRWYHIFLGPSLLFRGPVPPVPENIKHQVVQDYYRGHITKEDLQPGVRLDEQYAAALADAAEAERAASHLVLNDSDGKDNHSSKPIELEPSPETFPLESVDRPEPFYKNFTAFWLFLKRTILRGMFIPVVEQQTRTDGSKFDQLLARNIRDVHARAHKYDNKTEYLYSLLQAFTATTASFAHGYVTYVLPRCLLASDQTMSPTQWVHFQLYIKSGARVPAVPLCLFRSGFSLSEVLPSTSVSQRMDIMSCAI